MNVAGPVEPRWTLRTWAYVIAAVLIVQVGLLIYVGQTVSLTPVRPNLRTTVHFLADEWSSSQLDALPGLTEPTALALPRRESFSGAAWMRGSPLEYRPESWTEPPRWLALQTQALGNDFARLVAGSSLRPLTIADKPAPPMLRYEPNFPSDPLPARSTLGVEGDLANRALLRSLDLRSWPHQELLSNTVVQVLVDAQGFTLSTEPLESCGLPEADRHALKLASGARFVALPSKERDATGSGPLAWGKLVFHWHTLPATATNVPIALP